MSEIIMNTSVKSKNYINGELIDDKSLDADYDGNTLDININNNDEYDHYVDNYEIALTNQEHMLEDEYNKTHVPGVFSTIGFVIFIVKAVTGFITN